MSISKANLIGTIVLAILTVLLLHTIVSYLNLPEVHMNQEGYCIRVVSDAVYNCENLPSKYIHILVK